MFIGGATTLLLCASWAFAFVPLQLEDRGYTCVKNDCYRWASAAKGSAWCSSYLQITTYKTVTTTSTKISTATTNEPNVYTTITSTQLTTKTNVLSLGLFAPNPTITTITTVTTTAAPVAKRNDPYPSIFISSACSCLVGAAPTITKVSTKGIIASSTTTLTKPPTKTVSATTTITDTITTALLQTNLLPPTGTDTVTAVTTTTATAAPTSTCASPLRSTAETTCLYNVQCDMTYPGSVLTGVNVATLQDCINTVTSRRIQYFSFDPARQACSFYAPPGSLNGAVTSPVAAPGQFTGQVQDATCFPCAPFC